MAMLGLYVRQGGTVVCGLAGRAAEFPTDPTAADARLMHRECIKMHQQRKNFPEISLSQKHTKSMTSPATLQDFAGKSAGARWRMLAHAPNAPSSEGTS
jgi:hypothetical protein